METANIFAASVLGAISGALIVWAVFLVEPVLDDLGYPDPDDAMALIIVPVVGAFVFAFSMGRFQGKSDK